MLRSRSAGLLFVVIAGSPAAPAVAGPLTLRAQDVICVPGKRAGLAATLSRQITLSLRSNKPRIDIEFSADGRTLGHAITNQKGAAVLDLPASFPGSIRGST